MVRFQGTMQSIHLLLPFAAFKAVEISLLEQKFLVTIAKNSKLTLFGNGHVPTPVGNWAGQKHHAYSLFRCEKKQESALTYPPFSKMCTDLNCIILQKGLSILSKNYKCVTISKT
jgi:hypothetical protein